MKAEGEVGPIIPLVDAHVAPWWILAKTANSPGILYFDLDHD